MLSVIQFICKDCIRLFNCSNLCDMKVYNYAYKFLSKLPVSGFGPYV